MGDLYDDDIEQIAIIGMAGRFPGAGNVEQFWQNLREGKESITQFSDKELLERGVTKEELTNPDYVKSGLVLDGIDLFDAEFFGYTSKQAEIMDPQQRIFLEIAWEALENAGCNPDTYQGAIGVFGGAGGNDYRKGIAAYSRNITSGFESFQAMLGNEADYLTTRISYKLNLKGPSITLQTACSTSLVAIHTACQYLLTYQCDAALAGGVSVRLPQGVGYTYREGMIWSPDGHCRAFDAQAQGTMLGHGAGIVVLKRLSEAIAERDYIYAVIKGSAINNDGALKAGYTAPSVDGQSGAILMAQTIAGIDPASISYVEAHGTGTLLGDPVEIEALTKAFRSGTNEKNFCAIGSVKTNIGHLDAAAGVAGLIKTVLSLQNKEIPPSLHFKVPNPNIDFANSPFYVNAELRDWQSDSGPRRAGVSAFGIGGTNAHLVLEEAPVRQKENCVRNCQLLLLSAKTKSRLQAVVGSLANYLRNNPKSSLADVAYTLQTGRKHYENRWSIACEDITQAVTFLSEKIEPIQFQEDCSQTPNVIFMFSGQGSQYIDMGKGLYKTESVFRNHVDYCSEILKPLIAIDLRDILFPGPENISSAQELISQTRITQPALFVIEYSLAKLLESWGIIPKAMVGHSIGEYVAACLAGVFSVDDALSLVARRGAMMQRLDPGSMLAVPLSEEELSPLLSPELSLAVINGPGMTVISGQEDDIIAFKEKIAEERGLECRLLRTSHAFHSHMMEPIVDEYAKAVSSFVLNTPRIPFVSNVSGTWISSEEATAPEYWARHLRHPVRFFSCLTTLFAEKGQMFLEVGPGQVLTTLARQHPDNKKHAILASTRRPVERKEDIPFLLNTLGKLWTAGCDVDWQRFSSRQSLNKVPLPCYPFVRKRYWVGTFEGKGLSSPERELGESEHGLAGVSNRHNQTVPDADVAHRVKQIFSDLTGVSLTEIDDTISFAEYGLDSLLLTQLASALAECFSITVLFRQLSNETPNLKELIEDIGKRRYEDNNRTNFLAANRRRNTKIKNLIAIQPHGKKTPFILVHGDGANDFLPQWLDDDQPFYGYLHQGADGEEIRYKTVEEIAKHYLGELLQVLPDGPYIFGGFSFGGLIAYEMANILLKQGRDVPLLIMLDAFHPSYLRELGRIKTFRNLARKILNFPKITLKETLLYWLSLSYVFRGLPVPLYLRLRTRYILAIYIRAALKYCPSQISCPVVLLRAIDTTHDDSTNGWSASIVKDLSVQQVPGDHLSMIRSSENFKILATSLLECINSVQREE